MNELNIGYGLVDLFWNVRYKVLWYYKLVFKMELKKILKNDM